MSDDRERLRKPAPQSAPRPTPSNRLEQIAQRSLASPACPLPHLDRLEQSFGMRLGDIQAHQGPDARQAADQLGANAFATQGHVVLGQKDDLSTVAEETAHALQQSPHAALFGSFAQMSGLTDPAGPLEHDAARAASNVAAGRPASISLAAGNAVVATSPKPDVDPKLIELDPHEKKRQSSLDDNRNFISNQPDVQLEKNHTDPDDPEVLKKHHKGPYADPKDQNPMVKAFPPEEKPLRDDPPEHKLDRIPRQSSTCLFQGSNVLSRSLCDMEMDAHRLAEIGHKIITGKDFDNKKASRKDALIEGTPEALGLLLAKKPGRMLGKKLGTGFKKILGRGKSLEKKGLEKIFGAGKKSRKLIHEGEDALMHHGNAYEGIKHRMGPKSKLPKTPSPKLGPQEMADDLSKRINNHRVTAQTPSGKVDIDLRGKSHFDKPTRTRLETPHIHESKRHIGGSGKSSLKKTTRAATKQDIRTARKIIERRSK